MDVVKPPIIRKFMIDVMIRRTYMLPASHFEVFRHTHTG